MWLNDLLFGDSIAHTILVLAVVIAVGLALARIKIAGVSIGSAWILFVGIFVAHFGFTVDPDTVHFVREFGLVLFVFSIGLQVGPGFLSALRRGGLQLNLIAISVIAVSVVCTLSLYFATGLPGQTIIGILSGAVTNTPSLGAAQEAFANLTGTSDTNMTAGYAMAYPLAVVGIIGSQALVRAIFRIDIAAEAAELKSASTVSPSAARRMNLEVTNPAVFGKTIGEIHKLVPNDFVVSRIWHLATHSVELVDLDTVLSEGDKLLVITPRGDRSLLRTLFGPEVEVSEDLWQEGAAVFESRKVLLTRSKLNGVPLGQLSLRSLHGVNVTRVDRSGVELVASSKLRLLMGDRLTMVGAPDDLRRAQRLLGNSTRSLDAPNLIVLFLGIALGVLVGSIPFSVPGIPQPVKLGLAGGPLIVALILGRFGPRFRLVTYSTISANLMLREMGMALFLAGIGISSGGTFVKTVLSGGYWWVLWGLIITLVPLLTVGIIARAFFKVNYLTLIGTLAGATTDPPALSYAASLSDSDAPAIGYATVYPLTMFLRVIIAQVLVILLV